MIFHDSFFKPPALSQLVVDAATPTVFPNFHLLGSGY